MDPTPSPSCSLQEPMGPPDKGDGQPSRPRVTFCEATDFPFGRKEFLPPQHKFNNTSATPTSLLRLVGQVGLHDHSLLRVPNILISHPVQTSPGRTARSPRGLVVLLPALPPGALLLEGFDQIGSGFFLTLEPGSVLRGWNLETGDSIPEAGCQVPVPAACSCPWGH